MVKSIHCFPQRLSSILKSLVNMRFLSIAVACLLAFSLSTSASPILEIVDHAPYEPLMRFNKWLGGLDGINRTMSNNLELYTKYSPAVYQRICGCPLENILLLLVCFFFCLVQDNALTCALSL